MDSLNEEKPISSNSKPISLLKFIGIMLALILAIFLFLKVVETSFADQLDSSVTSAHSYAAFNQDLGTGYTSLGSVSFYISTSDLSQGLELAIIDCGASYCDPHTASGALADRNAGITDYGINATSTKQIATWTPALTGLDPTHHYTLWGTKQGVSGDPMTFYGITSGSQLSDFCRTSFCWSTDNLTSIYWSTTGLSLTADTLEVANGNTYSPISGIIATSSVSQGFLGTSIKGSYLFPSNPPANSQIFAHLYIASGSTSSPTIIGQISPSQGFNAFWTDGSSTTQYLPTNTNSGSWIAYTPILSNITTSSGEFYYITQYAVDSNQNILQNGTNAPYFYVNFGQDAGVNNQFIFPTSTPSSSLELSVVNTCNDPNASFWQGLLCAVFIPKQSTLNNFVDLGNTLGAKPPFAYISKISTIFQSLSVTSTPSTLPNDSTLNSYVFTPLKTFLSWILYIVLGIWIFKRFKHFQV